MSLLGWGQKPEIIATGPGPEDIALDTLSGTSPRLFVSCAERREAQAEENGIYAYHIESGLVSQMKINPNGFDFLMHPHGIDIKEIHDSVFLFVITHWQSAEFREKRKKWSDRHAVVKFLVSETTLKAIDIFEDPLMTIPNDLAVLDDGSFIFSNHTKKASNWSSFMGLFFKLGSVGYCSATGEFSILKKRMRYPNGILSYGSQIFVSTTREKGTYSFDWSGLELSNQQLMNEVKGSDNLNYFDKWLIQTSLPKPATFAKHLKDPKKKCPSEIYMSSLNKTGQNNKRVIWEDDGSYINACSAALVFEGNLYLAQVFDAWIVKVPLL